MQSIIFKISLILDFIKKPYFILAVILVSFFAKGVFLAAVFPIFSGQDEARHYNTIQFLLEPEEKSWEIEKDVNKRVKEKFETYNFSREIRGVAGAINSQAVESVPYDYLSFTDKYDGAKENELNKNKWEAINDQYPIDMVGGTVFYHRLASLIERFFSQDSILVRFFLIRIFSIILGTGVVFLSYLIAKGIGFSSKNSLIFSAIISFHPRFSIYYTNINYDVLMIFAFTLFSLGGILAIKNGISWKNILIMAISAAVAIFTKLTGLIVLAAFILLIGFLVFERTKNSPNKNKIKKYFLLSLVPVSIIFLLILGHYNFFGIFKEGDFNPGKYLVESLGIGRILLTSNAYWGNLIWRDGFIIENIIKIIWGVEFLSLIGVASFIFSKKKPDYLPEKKYIIFSVFMIFILQFCLRFADFVVFSQVGSLELGAPGRYFLPNLALHLILVFVGLGVLLRKKEHFDKIMIASLILMAAFFFYEVFNIIIPRYYL